MPEIQKQIGDVLKDRPAARVNADASVADAMEVMEENKSECVLIFEGDDMKGIFTSRDFLHRVAAVHKLPSETSISDVMSPNLELLNYSDCISYAIERMATCGYRNIVVKTESDQIALLSVWNVMSHLTEVLNEVEESREALDDDLIDELTDLGGG